jgi:hypothetical protein
LDEAVGAYRCPYLGAKTVAAPPKRNTIADKNWPHDFACELDAIPPDDLRELVRGQCQTNANQTAKCAKRIASGCQLTPLGQRGEAVLLEDVASAEVAIVVKVMVDRGVDGGEFLQRLDVPEFRHCPFPSSERLV